MVQNVEQFSLCRTALCIAGCRASMVSANTTCQKFFPPTIGTTTLEIRVALFVKICISHNPVIYS